MKYLLRVSALTLIFASAMIAQPKTNAVATSNHSVNRVAFASGPTPFCDPSDPSCGVPGVN